MCSFDSDHHGDRHESSSGDKARYDVPLSASYRQSLIIPYIDPDISTSSRGHVTVTAAWVLIKLYAPKI